MDINTKIIFFVFICFLSKIVLKAEIHRMEFFFGGHCGIQDGGLVRSMAMGTQFYVTYTSFR